MAKKKAAKKKAAKKKAAKKKAKKKAAKKRPAKKKAAKKKPAKKATKKKPARKATKKKATKKKATKKKPAKKKATKKKATKKKPAKKRPAKKATKKKPAKKAAKKKPAKKPKSEVSYRTTQLLEFPKITWERGSKPRFPDGRVLANALHARLGDQLGVTVQATKGFVTHEDGGWRIRCFVYVRGQDTLAVEVREVGEGLASWLKEGAKGADREARLGAKFGLKSPPPKTHEFDTNPGPAGPFGRLSAGATTNLRLLERDPQRLIREYAPVDEPPFQRTLSGYAAMSLETFSTALERFLKLRGCKRAAPNLAQVDAGIAALEKQLGASLPETYRALYRRLDGAQGLFFGHDLLSLKAARKQLETWQSIAREWSEGDLTDGYETQGNVVQARYCSERWLPLIDLSGGHFVALDFDPGSKGRAGQAIVFGRDVTRLRRVGMDLGDLLTVCLIRETTSPDMLSDVFEALAL